MEGTLKEYSFADIIQMFGYQRRTGILTLKRGEEFVTFVFHNGSIVGVEAFPHRVDTMLGRVLIKQGKISERGLERALNIQKKTNEKLGKILVNIGLISKEDLSDSLNLQATKILFNLFKWKDGEFKFKSSDTVEYDREFFSPIEVDNILMQGMQMLDEWPRITNLIRSKKAVFEPLPVKPEFEVVDEYHEGIGAKKISRIEFETLKLIDGRRSVEEIIDLSHVNEFITLRSIVSLIEKGLVREKVVKEVVEEKEGNRYIKIGAIAGIILSLFILISSFKKPFRLYHLGSPIITAEEKINKNKIKENEKDYLNFILKSSFNYGSQEN
ncbi:MAG: DUF4388 domain-containing protein [Candidatus Aminicenantia bacterium]